jgi:hypothetical protein
LDPNQRLSIDVIAANVKPMEPKKHATKFIKQCIVIVRDTILITIQEWNETKRARVGASLSMTDPKRPLEKSHGKFHSTSRLLQIR